MATANGADFSTQSYRHGVLIGNYNEDQFGCDLMSKSAASAAAFPATLAATENGGRLFSVPLSTTHTSYTDAGHDVVRDAVHADKVKARMAPDVSAGLLFAHRGSAPIDVRYQSSYAASFTHGGVHASPPPVDRTVAKLREQDRGVEASVGARENQSRQRSYRTAASGAFNPSSSV